MQEIPTVLHPNISSISCAARCFGHSIFYGMAYKGSMYSEEILVTRMSYDNQINAHALITYGASKLIARLLNYYIKQLDYELEISIA